MGGRSRMERKDGGRWFAGRKQGGKEGGRSRVKRKNEGG